MKKESIFKSILNTVSSFSWMKKGGTSITHEKMKPGTDFNQPVSDHDFDYFKELDDSEFAKLITLIFKQRGYSIASEEEQQEDIELVLKMNGETTYIQYAHWRQHETGIAVLEKLDAIMKEQSVRHGVVISTGLFTQEALDFSHGKHVLLINGVDLSQMVGTLKTLNDEDEKIDKTIDEMPELEPLCPICSREMIKRTARKGKNAGNTFWGCSQFPNCRGVISN